ncbi:MAG: 30S ribosome-binding factor RbfA [Planctomycetaceae bacterium]
MSSRRLLKAAEAIREVVASSILTELRDPRVRDVTVLGVEVSPDMREAKVSVSVMGPEAQQQLSLRGLQNAAGFLQSKIADRIETRYTPKLRFVLDQGTKNVFAVGEILARIRQEQSEQSAGDAAASSSQTDQPDDQGLRDDQGPRDDQGQPNDQGQPDGEPLPPSESSPGSEPNRDSP